MIGFAESFLSWVAATLIPGFVGLLVLTWASKLVAARYLAAFAFGIFLWFFVDTIGGSATLDVNSGFAGGTAQAGVVVLFVIGLLFVLWIDRNRNIFSTDAAIGKYGLSIPVLVAIAVGIHGLGEGAAFGSTAYSTLSTSLLDTFGGVSAGVAYVLHKGLEPMMIGACYSVYLAGQSRSTGRWLKDVFVLSLIFTIPSLLGAVTGYFINYDTTYFFALGTGTSIYAAVRLLAPLFKTSGVSSSRDSMRIGISLVLGFLAIYFAALFHS